MYSRICSFLLLWPLVGCMHIPLRSNTAYQAKTVSDLYQQQVLNNLAMFADDPNSLPYFSFANQGATGISDQGSLGASAGWARTTAGVFLFDALGTSASAQRTATSNFTLTPVNDPRKLELMRCAYQKVIANCCNTGVNDYCPDCQTRFRVFYTGDPDGDIRGSSNGVVTSECIGQACWFGVGTKKCVPRNCDRVLVGHYGKTFVWVQPGCRDELAKLTLVILDYAQNSPPVQVQKTVEYYVDERGLPTTFQKAVSKVTAQIGIKENNLGLLSQSPDDEVELRDSIEREIADIETQIASAQAKDRGITLQQLLAKQEELRAQKRYLDLQLKSGGLKEEYRRTIAPPAGPADALLLKQSLNALAF